MSKSDVPTSVKPNRLDRVVTCQSTNLRSLLPSHNLEVTASVVERGVERDRLGRTHYIKLDCRIVSRAGITVSTFNRFILLNSLFQFT